MAVKFRIKKGDQVVVLTGKDKGKTGEVLSVLRAESRVVVRNINTVKKHQKPTQENPGGIKQIEKSIHVSNVAHIDPETQKPTRVGYKMDGDKKVRFAKKSGATIA